jgi:hypothetical protein
MSRREHFCNRRVAARRAVSPFAGLRRVRLTRSTPEIRRFGGSRCTERTRLRASSAALPRYVGAWERSGALSADGGWRCLNHALTVGVNCDWEVIVGE